MVYRVQRNDTPAWIAQRLGYPGQAGALIAANPQKAKMVVHGDTTFKHLSVGEALNIPNGWRSNGSGTMSGTGLGAAADVAADAAAILGLSPADLCSSAGNPAITTFQQDYNLLSTTTTPLIVTGLYDSPTAAALQSTLTGSDTAPAACTSFTAPSSSGGSTSTVSLATLQASANAVIADSSICNGSNANVQNFQTNYNAYTNSSLAEDGLYRTTSAAAMASTAQISGITLNGSLPAACPSFASSGGGTTHAPPASGGTSTTTYDDTTITTTSTTPWVIAAVAAVAGAGVFYYLKKRPPSAKHHNKMKHKPVHHRLAHHHR